MDRYVSKCEKKLKEWNAPPDNWRCVDLIDGEEADFKCELCGYDGVRYIHVMEHDEFFEQLYVGCICAGVMEGDILAAKERERKMKNRSKRRLNFPRRKWQEIAYGRYGLRYRGKWVYISFDNGKYSCYCYGKETCLYHDKPITDFLSACYAAFDLVDPVEEILQ